MPSVRNLCALALIVVGVSASFTARAQLDAAGEGRRLYLKLNCSGCHGNKGQGGMGPKIAGEGDDVSEAVLQGEGGGMRSYRAYVTTTDINNLSAYLRSIGRPGEPTFTHWWEPVPSK